MAMIMTIMMIIIVLHDGGRNIGGSDDNGDENVDSEDDEDDEVNEEVEDENCEKRGHLSARVPFREGSEVRDKGERCRSRWRGQLLCVQTALGGITVGRRRRR
jgi:hypothetical protein